MNLNDAAITIRKATVDDVADLVRLQRLMFEAMHAEEPVDLDAADQAAAAYFNDALAESDFHGWLAVTESGWPVACGGLVVERHPPSPDNPTGRIAYITNVVTDPAYCRRGLARQIMQTMLRWISEQGITQVSLHANNSEALYKLLGFKPSNEMRLSLA